MALASAIIDRARYVLKDDVSTAYRWTDAELLFWLSDAQREIVRIDPTCNPKRTVETLVAGSRQTLPSDAALLIDVIRDMGTGRPVNKVSKAMFDMSLVDAYSTTAASVALNYYYDADRYAYYIAPSVAAGVEVEIIYSAIPVELTAVGDTLELRDVYIEALTEYLLYKAYMKDATYAGNAELGMAHFRAFQSAMGVGRGDS